VFTEEAIARAYALSGGQPWLVNALADQVVNRLSMAIPFQEDITADHIDLAKERIIQARQTHLDSLLARLQEDRVRRILEPIIAGLLPDFSHFDDDFSYVVDLGLVAPGRPPRIANPIYREIILRVLASGYEATVITEPRTYVREDGRLDLMRLLSDFADFWRQHADILAQGIGYQEAAPHLVLMGWLHRIVNGGGFIEREVGIGTDRIDLFIRWPYTDAHGHRRWQREAIEIKAFRDRDKGKSPMTRGLRQLDAYLDKL